MQYGKGRLLLFVTGLIKLICDFFFFLRNEHERVWNMQSDQLCTEVISNYLSFDHKIIGRSVYWIFWLFDLNLTCVCALI